MGWKNADPATANLISVKFHNETAVNSIVRGGAPVKGLTLVLANDGSGNQVVTRNDGKTWNSVAGGGWAVGNVPLIVDGATIIQGGAVLSFVTAGTGMKLQAATLISPVVTGTFAYNVHPLWNTTAQILPSPFLEEGDLVLDVKDGTDADTGVFVVDANGWSAYGPAQRVGACRLVFCEYPAVANTYFFSLVSGSPVSGNKEWRKLALAAV